MAVVVSLLFVAIAGQVWGQTRQSGGEAERMLTYIADSVISGKANKPITRSVVAPADPTGDLMFSKQSDLTSDLVCHYLDRAISHLGYFRGDTPRAREFLRYTGAKYIHWSHDNWGGGVPDWQELTKETDIVHGSEWGRGVVFETGVMECVSRQGIDNVAIPDWLYSLMEQGGVADKRKPGPRGPKYFSYEAMFDREAKDWPKHYVGMWGKDAEGRDVASVPDITMLETQIWYAYVIAEHIDAGFEGVLFGQIGLTGRRDKGWACAHALAEFAKRYAAKRAYRRAVFLSSHHHQVDYRGKPILTHLSWPSRLFYSSRFRHGMECGLYATEDGQHPARREFLRLLNAPHDLPILIEIDNYGNVGPKHMYAASPEGDDEITAYNKKPTWARAAFLRQYYFEVQAYENPLGNRRFRFAPSGSRPPYSPYKEDGGEEETIRELFRRVES